MHFPFVAFNLLLLYCSPYAAGRAAVVLEPCEVGHHLGADAGPFPAFLAAFLFPAIPLWAFAGTGLSLHSVCHVIFSFPVYTTHIILS